MAQRFADDWFRQFDKPTDGYKDEAGFISRLPLRLESTEVMVYGTVDADKMWEDFKDEPFQPILVGGKAVIVIMFNNFVDTDCGGSYLETWYNTFVTPKSEPQLSLPSESPFSMVIQDPRSLSFLMRVFCADQADNPGAAMKAIHGGRAVFGFPKHPNTGDISFKYVNEGNNVEFEGSHGGKSAVSLKVRLPEADAGVVSIPVEVQTSPTSGIGAPRLGGTHLGMNGAHQTRYASALKCTQHCKPWDASTDSLTFGEDAHYAAPISRWGFDPVLKVHSPDFKIVAFKPSGWITGEDAARAVVAHEQQMAAGVKLGAVVSVPVELKSESPAVSRFTDDWFRQFDKPTDGYKDEAGFISRLPLRLESTEVMVYGTVDADKMWEDFKDEPFQPILVGGKAVIVIMFNNFVDTDCGGSYLETWYNTFVTPKSEPQLSLPSESPFSMVIQDPRSLSFLMRVFCADQADNPGAAMKAIHGGRAVFGFPKHPNTGDISFKYVNEGNNVEFEGSHGGKSAVSLKVRLPEADAGVVSIPVEVQTSPTSGIGAPRLGGTHLGMNGAHQTRYASALKCTQHCKPWDASTDSLTFGEDAHYAAPISRWGFDPVLKVHSPDFKIVAFKPSGWITGEDAARAVVAHEQQMAAGVKNGALSVVDLDAVQEEAKEEAKQEPKAAAVGAAKMGDIKLNKTSDYNPEWQPDGNEGGVDTNKLPWLPLPQLPGCHFKPLRVSPETGAFTILIKAPEGFTYPKLVHLGAADTFVTSGNLTFSYGSVLEGSMTQGFWGYVPANSVVDGCVAVEETEYLTTFYAPVAFLDAQGKIAQLLTGKDVKIMATKAGITLLPSTLSEALARKGPGYKGRGTVNACVRDNTTRRMCETIAKELGEGQSVNPHFVDTNTLPWIINPDAPEIGLKVMRVSTETGNVSLIVRQNGQAPPHFHLGPADFFITSGRIGYRAGPKEGYGPGTYMWEPAGARHEATQRVNEPDGTLADLIYTANLYGPIQFDSGVGTPVLMVLSWMQYLELANSVNTPLLQSTFPDDSGTMLASNLLRGPGAKFNTPKKKDDNPCSIS